MAVGDSVQRVRIYLRRDDQWKGEARYLALLEELRRLGATGATALQGLAGFGPGQRFRPAVPERSDRYQSVVVEWVERAERVARMLPQLEELIGEALVTLEEVAVYRGRLRAGSPFGPDRAVGDVMRQPPPPVSADTPLRQAVATMQAASIVTLPVQDEAGRLLGVIAAADLRSRAGMRLPLALLDALTPEEREQALAPLDGRVARQVMRLDPCGVNVRTAIPQAIVSMVEWGHEHLPVIDHAGTLVGLIGQTEILCAAVEHASSPSAAARDAEPPASVASMLQPAPTVLASTGLDQALARLLVAPEQPLLVVDDGRLVGALDLASVLRGLYGAERAAVLTALHRPGASVSVSPLAGRPCADLCAPPPPEIAPHTGLIEAARRLLEAHVDRLAVVDGERRLLGIIGRGGVMRALRQQSE
ncbi:MAG: DUF190 domain-containing protein [Oscillochloridaceae bacterium]|nr:DUF190 domain-containing protein [Chloroflexaceae bacterium]MDW8391767.1 DUF190 domain-containing protein [Oscillochloridaceae bacterium]